MRNFNVIFLASMFALLFIGCNTLKQASQNNDSPVIVPQNLEKKPTTVIQEVASSHTDAIEHSKPAVTLGKIASLKSTILNKTIPLSIHLPANYDSSKKNYPVLYMMGSEYRSRFAMLAATLDYMGEGQMPEVILVGIDLPEGNSILLPTWKEKDTSIPDNYIRFFEKELMPHIENRFRTAPFKILFGGSNSGFFSVYTLLNNPLLFNGYFASSPSLSIIPKEMQEKIKSAPFKTLSKNRFLHIIYSDTEGLTKHVSEFTRVLTDHKPAHLTYKVDALANQGHVPPMDFALFLHSLYPDYNPFNFRKKMVSLGTVKQHFKSLSIRYGYEIQTPISILFDLGFVTTRSKDLIAAEEVFQYSLEVYPEAKESYLGMGILRRTQGQLESAKVLFEKALTIDPEFSLAKRFLQRLKKQMEAN